MDVPLLSKAARTVPGDAFTRAADALATGRCSSSHELQRIENAISEGRLGSAEEQLNAYLSDHPEDADALFLKARTELRAGRIKPSLAVLVRAVEHAPDFLAARFNLADLLYKNRNFEEALVQTDILLGEEPRNPLFRQLRSNILLSINENEQALLICEELVAENPERADSWISYGHVLRAVGRQQDSVAAYRRALALKHSCGKAWWGLANMKTVRFSDSELDTMLMQAQRTDIEGEDRIQIQYALGKAYEDRRNFTKSFDFYARGNAALRVRIPYDPEGPTRLVKANKSLFTPEFLASKVGAGSPDCAPIFVVCLPRSGSTLIEQILSSHSQIEGAGELPYITALAKELEQRSTAGGAVRSYTDALASLDPEHLRLLGEKYVAQARSHLRLDRPFFVDKKPPNWFHIGLIHLILPNARIIDARRHPMAVSFSNFRQFFRKARPRLAELGRLYRDYVELMAHFDRVLPGKIHRVIYENMVANPEKEVRNLLAYLALPFEENCLRFYENKRSVLTPSSEQVRRPIHSDAIEQWRNYEPWLGPLVETLGDVLTCYPDVPDRLR